MEDDAWNTRRRLRSKRGRQAARQDITRGVSEPCFSRIYDAAQGLPCGPGDHRWSLQEDTCRRCGAGAQRPTMHHRQGELVEA